MRTVADFLDSAKEKTGSDYQTAKTLGVSRQAISRMRSTGTIRPGHAAMLAALINGNPTEIVAASDCAKHPENAKLWGRWVAATVIMSVAAGLVFSFENNNLLSVAALDPVYIMRICGYIFVSVMAFLYLRETIAIDYAGGSKSTG